MNAADTQTPAFNSIDELRIAFGAVCERDFTGASLETMTTEASRQLREYEDQMQSDASGGAALLASMLRELLTTTVGHAGPVAIH